MYVLYSYGGCGCLRTDNTLLHDIVPTKSFGDSFVSQTT